MAIKTENCKAIYLACMVVIANLYGCSLVTDNQEISRYQNCKIELEIFQWGGEDGIDISGSIRDRWGYYVDFDSNNMIKISGNEGIIKIDTSRISRKYPLNFSDSVFIDVIINGEIIWKSKYKIHPAPEIQNLGGIGRDTIKFNVTSFGYKEIAGGVLLQIYDSLRYSLLEKHVGGYCSSNNPFTYSLVNDLRQNKSVDSIKITLSALNRFVSTSNSEVLNAYSQFKDYWTASISNSINHPYSPMMNIYQTGHTKLQWKYKYKEM